MNALSVLGIDFGTTKTYLSKCPEEEPSPVSVDFGDGRDGIPSAILYRRGKAPLIGQTALDEYGEASYWERNTYRLATNFKADLARSEKARTAASDFLSALLAEARAQRLDMEPAGRRVLFGAPSESDEAFRAALEETAGRAGYGVPFLVDEPKGERYRKSGKRNRGRRAKGIECGFSDHCRGGGQEHYRQQAPGT